MYIFTFMTPPVITFMVYNALTLAAKFSTQIYWTDSSGFFTLLLENSDPVVEDIDLNSYQPGSDDCDA